MPDQHTDLIQGTLEMLILKTLALTPMRGYGIALRIEQISDGAFRVNPGSLLAAATKKEQPESLVKTRDIFNEAGHVFSILKSASLSNTRAELANPGEPIHAQLSSKCSRMSAFRVALNHCQTDVVAKRTTVREVL